MPTRTRVFLWTGLVSVLFGGIPPAAADTPAQHIKMKLVWTKGDQTVSQRVVSVFYTPTALRVLSECERPQDPNCSDLYYDAAKQTVYYIEPSKQTVLKITKADMDEVAKTLGPFLQYMLKMQQEAQKKSKEPPTEPQTWKFVASGQSRVLEGRTCKVYQVFLGSRPVGTQCVATYTALKLDEATMDTLFKSLAELMASFTKYFEQGLEQLDQNQPPTPWVYLLQGRKPPYQGIPVHQAVDTPNGMHTESTLLEAGPRKVPEDTFGYPPNFKVVTLKEMMQSLVPSQDRPQKPPQR